MNKLVEILKSWGIAINPNERQSKLAEARIQICDACEHKKTSPTVHCGVCGCLLKGKIYSPVENACPEGKWAEVDKAMSDEIQALAAEIPTYNTNPVMPEPIQTEDKTVQFVCAQPATLYYAWQVEVMINNFLSMGVNPTSINIVCALDETETIPTEWFKLLMRYNPVKFFFYLDTRTSKNYVSSIRPNILKQHWLRNPSLRDDIIFYHDCDIAFTRPVSEWLTTDLLKDNNWYGSNCNSYLSSDYIESKGQDILNAMCNISGIPKNIIQENNENNIGAQYIMKDVSPFFWLSVEEQCEKLYTDITQINNVKKQDDSDYMELQIWCADMWAILFTAWNLGKNTIVHGNLGFSWSTDTENDWYRYNIYHNAGVTSGNQGYFFKGAYMNRLPYNEPDVYIQDSANKKYWDLIQQTGKNSCLLE